MNGKELFEATEYFRVFPEPEEVFAGDVEEHCKYLLPLASVDLSHVNPAWEGTVHWVCPIEPYDGCVGEDTEEHHTYLCRMNWVGYRIEDSKYRLACDFGYFLKRHYEENAPQGERATKTHETLLAHYDRAREGYRLRKEHFRECGCLHNAWAKRDESGKYEERTRVELVRELGGVSLNANWSELDLFPLSQGDDYVDEEGEPWTTAFPKTEDGRDFAYIGQIRTHNYLAENKDFSLLGGCDILLFYDPQDKVALTTFEWS